MKRFRKWGEHCPICEGHPGIKQGIGERCAGFASDDGEYVYCQREQFAGSLELNEKTQPPTFCHKMYGPCNCGTQHNPPHTSTHNKKIDEIYSYHDAQGQLVYQAVRYEPKGFSQRRPLPGGKWAWNMTGVETVLYHLPALLKAPSDVTIYIAEGERKVETLEKLGLVATCNVGGAGKWDASYSEALRDRHIIILPDNDAAGEAHAKVVTEPSIGIVASIKIVNLPGLPEKGDIVNWVASGGTREQLEALVSETPYTWQKQKRKFTYASGVQIEPVNWLWKKRIARGMGTLMVGDPGLGKSMTLIKIAAAVSTGGMLPDNGTIEPGGVIIMSPEDSEAHTIVPRLVAAGADLSKIILLNTVTDYDAKGKEYERPISFPDDAPILEEAIEDCHASLAIIDPVLSMIDMKYDSHKDQAVRHALGRVLSAAEKQGCAVVGVMHLNKGQNGNALYRSGASIAWVAMFRVGLFVVPDPDNEQGGVIVNHKNNLASKTSTVSLRYCFHETRDEIGFIEWEGESSYSQSELLNQGTPTDNPKSELETDILSVLRENGLPMTPSMIHEKLPDKSIDAIEKVLKRRVEQGVLIRPNRGLYTYNGNPLYATTTKDENNRVGFVGFGGSGGNVGSIGTSYIADTDMSVLGNGHQAASEVRSTQTDKTDTDNVDKSVSVSVSEHVEQPVEPANIHLQVIERLKKPVAIPAEWIESSIRETQEKIRMQQEQARMQNRSGL